MKVYINGKKKVTLTTNDYKASGGEGSVYCKGDTAYKIYNDPGRMIPEQKVAELKKLNIPNVLAPIDILFGEKRTDPIGFTMKYISDTEYLCKLFTDSFRKRNNIKPVQIANIVKIMQETLMEIHKKNFLVVDFNEMNFLIDKSYTTPYFIDVNSYQTESFPATAIMDSVRDPMAKKNTFSESTDWFAFAVVTFQLYLGCHPYKGKHPDYSGKEIASFTLMDQNLSVFNPEVRLPANCQDWSLIPKPYLDWYREIFMNGKRTPPPFADSIEIIHRTVPHFIKTTKNFIMNIIEEYDQNIDAIYHFNGTRYTIINNKIYRNKKCIIELYESYDEIALTTTDINHLIMALYSKNRRNVTFKDEGGDIISTVASDAMMEMNGSIYTTNNGILFENSFTGSKNKLHLSLPVCELFEPAYTLFKGMAVQDIIQKCWIAIPFRIGSCSNIHVKELDGMRILDGQCHSGNNSHICILIAELIGAYKRCTIIFNNDATDYSIRIEDITGIEMINMTVLNNNLCVTVTNNSVMEAFFSNQEIRIIETQTPSSSMALYNDGSSVFFTDDKRLLQISLKN